MTQQTATSAPAGYHTVNPWVIARGATSFIEFLERVFDGREDEEARTLDSDSLLIHAEVRIGDSVVMIFDSKPDWAPTPSFLQVYVADAADVLERARSAGATVITELSDFVYGERLARFRDPWDNLWWINDLAGGSTFESAGEDGFAADDEPGYIYRSIVDEMRSRAGRR